MDISKLIGLNTKWYRYQNKLTQEQFAEAMNFKISYVSYVENGSANITARNIELIANYFKIPIYKLFDENTAQKATQLPIRIDMMGKK